jgi:N-acetyl-anhydromuramyl-L-alanine amidase AmpD
MPFALKWLPRVLFDAGLKVAEVDGWEDRGRSEMGQVKGVICHHTAGNRNGNMPSLNVIINGREGLPGPLSQLGLGRDGTYYVVAAGRCNHAGPGNWQGFTSGNMNFIGIEAENTGLPEDAWPQVQYQAYTHGVAAILKKIGANAIMCAGHKEYALPQGRKTDPTFDMDDFRIKVSAIMAGTAPRLSIVPAIDGSGRPTLRRGSTGELVSTLQRAIGILDGGVFDSITEAAVRNFQRDHALVPDGIVGPRTWAAIQAL